MARGSLHARASGEIWLRTGINPGSQFAAYGRFVPAPSEEEESEEEGPAGASVRFGDAAEGDYTWVAKAAPTLDLEMQLELPLAGEANAWSTKRPAAAAGPSWPARSRVGSARIRSR